MKFKPVHLLIGAALGAVSFIITDCSSGFATDYTCKVEGRRKVDAWVETRVSTDSDGHISTSVIHHPDEFYVFCYDVEHELTREVGVNAALFHTVTNGHFVTVHSRVGRWTKINYLSRISDY